MNQIQELIQKNFLASYSYLQKNDPRAQTKRFGDCYCLCTGYELTDYNLIFLDAKPQVDLAVLKKDLQESLDFFARADKAFCLWYAPYLQNVVSKLDFEIFKNDITEHQGQYLSLANYRADVSLDFEIVRIDSVYDLADFGRLIAHGWDLSVKLYQDFLATQALTILRPDCPMHIYLGKIKGKVCVCTEVFVDNASNSIGIYFVTTEKKHRQKGYAKALQASLLQKYSELGYAHAVVLSSPLEQKLMNSLGFENYGFWTECY